MGAIKDIVDLTTQLSSSVQDRKLATEILKNSNFDTFCAERRCGVGDGKP